MVTFGAFWGQVWVFQLQTPEYDSLDQLGLLQRLSAYCMIFLHVQHVSAGRISHGKAARPSVRLSVCLSVAFRYSTTHVISTFSSAFLLVMCIVVDNDIRIVTVLVPSNLCVCDYCSYFFIYNEYQHQQMFSASLLQDTYCLMFVVMVSLYSLQGGPKK